MIEIPSLTTVLSRLADRTIKDPSVNFRTMVELAGLSPTIDFVGASLQGIDFRDEDLRGFNFSNADLTGADFRRADITDANFEGASLIGAIGLDKKYINQGDEDADLRPPDFDARKVRELILQGKKVPETWVPFVVELDFNSEPLQNLELIADFRNLRSLDLTKTAVQHLGPLKNLPQLRELGLGDTDVQDISALDSLSQLRVLDLTNTKVETLSALAKMHQLQQLFLLNTSISELGPISGISGLSVICSSALARDMDENSDEGKAS